MAIQVLVLLCEHQRLELFCYLLYLKYMVEQDYNVNDFFWTLKKGFLMKMSNWYWQLALSKESRKVTIWIILIIWPWDYKYFFSQLSMKYNWAWIINSSLKREFWKNKDWFETQMYLSYSKINCWDFDINVLVNFIHSWVEHDFFIILWPGRIVISVISEIPVFLTIASERKIKASLKLHGTLMQSFAKNHGYTI